MINHAEIRIHHAEISIYNVDSIIIVSTNMLYAQLGRSGVCV